MDDSEQHAEDGMWLGGCLPCGFTYARKNNVQYHVKTKHRVRLCSATNVKRFVPLEDLYPYMS